MAHIQIKRAGKCVVGEGGIRETKGCGREKARYVWGEENLPVSLDMVRKLGGDPMLTLIIERPTPVSPAEIEGEE